MAGGYKHEFRHKEPAKKETGKTNPHRNRLKAPKAYTFNKSYKERPTTPHKGETMAEIHERAVEKIIEGWKNRATATDSRYVKGFNMSDADIAFYDKRAAEWDRLNEEKETLEPVKDYARRNIINHKLDCIRADFEKLGYYSKIHNVKSHSCPKDGY